MLNALIFQKNNFDSYYYPYLEPEISETLGLYNFYYVLVSKTMEMSGLGLVSVSRPWK